MVIDRIFSCFRLAAFAAGLAVATLLLFPHSASAKYASIVLDADTGEVYHSVNAQTRNFPASLTKLMTLYLLFEAVENGKLSMNSRMRVSRRAAAQPASKLGLRAGGTIKVETAVLALIIKSANDVATVVAETLGGTERKFAMLMTAKARELGMSRTTFRNASGLPHRGQLSTARDMSTLARAVQAHFPKYYGMFGRKAFAFGGRTYRTHNKLLKTYHGADGLKTGYIRASGYNVITSAERSGQRLIGVVFGGNSARSRNRHMASLLDRAFDKKRREALASNGVVPGRKPSHRLLGATTNQKVLTSSGNVWGIQVGAFYSRRPALAAARKAAQTLGAIAEGGQITLMPLHRSKRRILYRSRILGIGRTDAYRACRKLTRHRIPCMEVRLPAGVAYASTGPASEASLN